MAIFHHARRAAPRAILACRASPSRQLWLWPARRPKKIGHSDKHEPKVTAQEKTVSKPSEGKTINLKKLNLDARKASERNQETANELSHCDPNTTNTKKTTKAAEKRPSARLSECPAIYDPEDLDLGSRKRQESFYQRQLPWFLGGGPF